MTYERESSDEVIGKAIAAVLILIFTWPVIILSLLWKAYVLTVMWGWFAVEAYALPRIGLAVAVGIVVVVNMLNYNDDESAEEDTELFDRVSSALMRMFIPPLVALGLGWIAHGCM